MDIIDRDIDNNFTGAIDCGRKGRGFHTGGNWERYSPILMKSGRAAAWVARSASSSSSHLAAISGSGSPRRLLLRLLRCCLHRRCLQPLSSSHSLSLPLSFVLSLSSQRNLRRWKTRLDSEFIKMHAASLRIRSEYLSSFTRELYFKRAATSPNADMKSAMIEEHCCFTRIEKQWKGWRNWVMIGIKGDHRRWDVACKVVGIRSRGVSQIRCCSQIDNIHVYIYLNIFLTIISRNRLFYNHSFK